MNKLNNNLYYFKFSEMESPSILKMLGVVNEFTLSMKQIIDINISKKSSSIIMNIDVYRKFQTYFMIKDLHSEFDYNMIYFNAYYKRDNIFFTEKLDMDVVFIGNSDDFKKCLIIRDRNKKIKKLQGE